MRRLNWSIKIDRSREDYITRSFIICTAHQLLLFGWFFHSFVHVCQTFYCTVQTTVALWNLLWKFQWPWILEQFTKILTARLIQISVLDRRQLYGVCTAENVKNTIYREKICLHTMMPNETDSYFLLVWMWSMPANICGSNGLTNAWRCIFSFVLMMMDGKASNEVKRLTEINEFENSCILFVVFWWTTRRRSFITTCTKFYYNQFFPFSPSKIFPFNKPFHIFILFPGSFSATQLFKILYIFQLSLQASPQTYLTGRAALLQIWKYKRTPAMQEPWETAKCRGNNFRYWIYKRTVLASFMLLL